MTNRNALPPIDWVPAVVLTGTFAAALVLVPLYGLLVGYSAASWFWFALFLILTGLSITAGYHRLWSHKAYKAHPFLRVAFALGGACALQNDVFNWAADHRRHHAFVDNNNKDPYSAGRGFWFSHIGWILRRYPSGKKDFSNIKDLQKDPILQWQHKQYLALVLIMNIAVPAFLGYLGGSIIHTYFIGHKNPMVGCVITSHFQCCKQLRKEWGIDLNEYSLSTWFNGQVTNIIK